MQTIGSARSHRKQPLPKARVPGTRFLGRVGPSIGPGMRGGGARVVSGQRCGATELQRQDACPRGVRERGVDPIWLMQKKSCEGVEEMGLERWVPSGLAAS